MPAETLSLREAAEALGVHYMTAYRYVRLGMLHAEKEGGGWRVRSEDLTALRRQSTGHTRRGTAPWSERLCSRLLAGDEAGSWGVVEAALASGTSPADIHLQVLAPAMRAIGDGWQLGSTTIALEHRATAIAQRLVGRLGGRFAMRGRSKGCFVIGTPPAERHSLPATMVADVLRGVGFDVVDMGCDLPIESFVEAVVATKPLTGVAVSVTYTDGRRAAGALIQAVRQATDAPVLIGGWAMDPELAASLGADAYAENAASAAEWALGIVTA